VSVGSAPPGATVVIPTYNYASVLPYSIGSVLDQCYADFEVVVVGDGCTDESAAVVRSFRDPRVHWHNLPRNTGHQSEPNNEALRRARGAVIAYLGHDDLWLPNHLEVLMSALETGCPAAHTSVLIPDPGIATFSLPPRNWSYRRGAWVPPTSLAVRRDVAMEVGGWRHARSTGTLNPEEDFLARIFDVAGPPCWIPRVTCVKLSASQRRNVYRARPTHEQEYWLAQIRSADDPERAMCSHLGRYYALAGDRVPPPGLAERAWRSARHRLRKGLGLSTDFSAESQIRRNRRLKGLK
jgi:glycosyltransferase involved in cell wall biosynthesis